MKRKKSTFGKGMYNQLKNIYEVETKKQKKHPTVKRINRLATAGYNRMQKKKRLKSTFGLDLLR